ncbi:MAG: helix-turn-helix domain-containing protein [Reyranella sp.]
MTERAPQRHDPLPRAGSAPDRIAVQTSDIDEFVSLICRLFGHHRILSLGGHRHSASVLAQRCGTLVVGQLEYGVDASVDVDEARPGWVITHALGTEGATDSQRFVSGDLMMYAPEWCGRIDVTRHTQMRNTFVPRATMDDAVRRLLGETPDRPVVFTSRIAPNSVQAERLRRIVELMYTADGGSHTFTAALQHSWQHMFAMELLSVWPHSLLRHLERPALAPRALRRACEYIDAHLEDVVSVGDVARAASVGVRALELGFARHLGLSPMRYFRDRRLDAARRDLCSAVNRPRVADVALKWGFSNPGQFAKAYRERFGELPSSSLVEGRRSVDVRACHTARH